MFARLEIRLNDGGSFADVLNRMREFHEKLPQAVAGALNAKAHRAANEMVEAITERSPGIPEETVRQAVTVIECTSGRHPVARVMVLDGPRLPLKYFHPEQTSKGVEYQVLSGGSVRLARSAFGPNVRSGDEVVQGRIPRFGASLFRRSGARQPLLVLRGPSVLDIFKLVLIEKENDPAFKKWILEDGWNDMLLHPTTKGRIQTSTQNFFGRTNMGSRV